MHHSVAICLLLKFDEPIKRQARPVPINPANSGTTSFGNDLGVIYILFRYYLFIFDDIYSVMVTIPNCLKNNKIEDQGWTKMALILADYDWRWLYIPSQEEYSASWEEANQSVQSAIRLAEQAYLALEKARASQIAYEIQHAEMEYQKAMKQVQAAQRHLPYVSTDQQEKFSQAEQMLNDIAPTRS